MEDPAAGYRALHAKLKKEEDFKDVSLKKAMARTSQNVERAPDFVLKVLVKPGADSPFKSCGLFEASRSYSAGRVHLSVCLSVYVSVRMYVRIYVGIHICMHALVGCCDAKRRYHRVDPDRFHRCVLFRRRFAMS